MMLVTLWELLILKLQISSFSSPPHLTKFSLMEYQSRELLLSFSSLTVKGRRWAINVEGTVVEITEVVLAKIHANPTRVWGWSNHKLWRAWKFIFPLTEVGAKEGRLPWSDPAWKEASNPW